jgi:hypothetical protein
MEVLSFGRSGHCLWPVLAALSCGGLPCSISFQEALCSWMPCSQIHGNTCTLSPMPPVLSTCDIILLPIVSYLMAVFLKNHCLVLPLNLLKFTITRMQVSEEPGPCFIAFVLISNIWCDKPWEIVSEYVFMPCLSPKNRHFSILFYWGHVQACRVT